MKLTPQLIKITNRTNPNPNPTIAPFLRTNDFVADKDFIY